MSRLFISYKREEQDYAFAVRQWLVDRQGWHSEDIFVDIDQLRAGDQWAQKLFSEAEGAEVMLFLASEASLLPNSFCYRELRHARGTTIAVTLKGLAPNDERLHRALPFGATARQITALDQQPMEGFEFVSPVDGRRGVVGLNRRQVESIGETLRDLGVAPNSFEWSPTESGPYPGLRALQEGDEAIFCGRDLEVRDCIRTLEQLKDSVSDRALLIQAPSGAGKSSFLRAGLWRRLRRHAGFTPLSIVRTRYGVLNNDEWGLTAGLFQLPANHLKLSRQEIKVQVDSNCLGFIAKIADADKPEGGVRRTILLGIDQAEEIADLTPKEDAELKRLLDIIIAAPADLDIRLLLAARDDSVDATLERLTKAGLRHEAIRDLRLHRLPTPRFRDVILGPAAAARRAGFALAIDERLAEALTVAAAESVAEVGDALPLLALALQRMVAKCLAPDGRVSLQPEEAKAFFDIAIAEATRDALNKAKADERALRRLIIPRLATWDPRVGATGAARRQVATAIDLFDDDRADLQPLADALVDQRLLTRSRGEKAAIYEVAHEALLRVAPLGDLIVALRDKFVRAEVLKFEAREWVQSGFDGERLARTGERLREANQLLQDPDFGSDLLKPELRIRGYLDACQERATAEAEQRRQRTPHLAIRKSYSGRGILFVSNASADDAEVSALENWLTLNGFTDIFVDHNSIAGDDKWQEALRASAGSCRVVVLLVTTNWLASNECFSEFGAAWYMGKRIIPLFLLPPTLTLDEEAKNRLARVRGEEEGIDLAPCLNSNRVLDIDMDRSVASRLKKGLLAAGADARVGLDPETFAINHELRSEPFPGLSSFSDDDADAALFYGRSSEIAQVLEELRSMRAARDSRPLVILGPSGVGKTSLLKAGIIPRLRREAPAWLPLRSFRPGADPLLNFAEAIARTLADFGQREAHGVIRDRLLVAWSAAERNAGSLTENGVKVLEAALDAEGQRLRMAANSSDASILIGVDQAEEMARTETDSAEALSDYLRVALGATRSPWQLVFTIPTDSFPELQSHRRFENLSARGYDLRAIPIFRFGSVVEEPARRYGVEIDPALVDALMNDAPKENALPLLAFALQRLWRMYAASGRLTRDAYYHVGGLKGLIDDAAERALRGIEPEHDVPLPASVPSERLNNLGARTFVPSLAQVDDQGAIIRRVAEWSRFSEEQQELLARFDRWRLVMRRGSADGGTVEVAHEALLRVWTRLNDWLEPERARLDSLRPLSVAAEKWEQFGRRANLLTHSGARLAEAHALEKLPRYAERLTSSERAYIQACQHLERGTNMRRKLLLVTAVIFVFGIGVVAGSLR